MGEEIAFENGRIARARDLDFERAYCIPSCITRRPLPTYQISLKSKKRFVIDGRTDIWDPLYYNDIAKKYWGFGVVVTHCPLHRSRWIWTVHGELHLPNFFSIRAWLTELRFYVLCTRHKISLGHFVDVLPSHGLARYWKLNPAQQKQATQE